MVPSDSRWTDDRLDERFTRYDERFAETRREMERLARIVDAMAGVPGKLDDVAAATTLCRAGIAEVNERLDDRDEQRAQERIASLEQREREAKAAREEKKKDRRWIIGTLLATGTLIVAAVGVLLGVVT